VKILKEITKLDVFIFILLIITFGANFYYIYQQNADSKFTKGKITNVVSEVNDGGIVYQELEVAAGEEKFTIKQEVEDSNTARYSKGDKVILEKSQDQASYSIKNFDRTFLMIASLVILAVLLIASIGLDDLKELVPILLVLPFVISGILPELMSNMNLILLGLVFFPLLTFLTTFVNARKLSITLSITIASLLSLLTVFLLSLSLFRLLKLTDIYKSYVDVRRAIEFEDFSGFFHFSILVIVLSTIINNSIAVSSRARKLVSRRLKPSTMIKKIVIQSQKDIARRANSLFFVFLGITLIPLLIAYQNSFDFWNSARVVEGFTYFIISLFGVILSVLFTSIVMTIYFKIFIKN